MSSRHKACVTYQVPYADTDRLGVVYYGNYLIYFERARTQLLHDFGFPYTALEARGFALPVITAHVDYRGGAGYDDTLTLYGWLGWARHVRLQVNCAVYCGSRLLAEGYTVHAFVERETLKPVRMPPDIAAVLRGDNGNRG